VKIKFLSLSLIVLSSAIWGESVEQRARQILEKGQVSKEADFFKRKQNTLKKQFPGLYGKWLEEEGDVSAACQFYEKDLKNRPNCSDGVKLRLANCYAKVNDWNKAMPIFDELSRAPLLTYDIDVLYPPSHYVFTHEGIGNWANYANAVLSVQASRLSFPKREELANLMVLLIAAAIKTKNEELVQKVRTQLFISLPESKTSVDYFKQEDAKKWVAAQGQSEILARARMLMALNQNNEVIETLKPHLKTKLKDSQANCEARFLIGKAYRQNRSYQDAKEFLHPIIKECEGDVKRDAFYVASRLAAIDETKESLKVFDKFLEEYSDHSYADDVMLWKINVLKKVGSTQDVHDSYDTFFKKYAGGDKHHEVSFRRALFFASHGNVKEALDLLKTGKEDHCAYWYGRLLVYPSLTSFKENENANEKSQGVTLLRELGSARPTSYYGFMAHRLASKADSVPIKIPKINFKKTVSNLMPAKSNEDFKKVQCLIGAGYDEEARIYLEQLINKGGSIDEFLALANESLKIHRPDISHQAMRKAGLAFPWNFDEKTKNAAWQLSFPKAYEEDFKLASKKTGVSEFLLAGLCREESTFNKNALSWAGARGLCQLLPSAGKEIAKKFHHVEYEGPNSLYNPKINIMLAAEYVASDLKHLDNPLLAMAAYNAGLGSVNRWVEKLEKPFPIDTFVEHISFPQTRDYVKKVTTSWLTYAWLYGDISKVNFDLLIE